MSTEVENRVVDMKFNNSAFEAGVAKTMGTLDALKGKLNFSGASKGLSDLQDAGNRFTLQGMGKSLDDLTHKFSILNIAGVTALTNIVNKAVNAGVSLLKSFTINPISDGFNQYQQQINATQTIIANTAASGGNLKNVTATLATLNDYANKTIYNFSDMATNLGTFTSAGVKLVPASQAIQGLSNVAAAAGASTQAAAGAMYQLSQALGRGHVQAQDWNSVVAAGMASSNFKSAILETAKAIGTLKIPKTESVAQWEKAGNSFQSAMSSGQITSAVLIQTLQAMTGNMTDAQLAAKGYTKEQIKTIQGMAKQAAAAATNIKTVKALIDNTTQSIGSSYAQVFKTLIGDLPTATKELTALSGVLNHLFVDPINHLNTFLEGFIKLKGREEVIDIIKNLFHALGNVLKPIAKAFREVFPPTTAKQLRDFAVTLKWMTSHLIAGKDTMEKIRQTFVGVFTIVKIGLGVILGIGKGFFALFHLLTAAAPAVLSLTSTLGALIGKLGGLLNNSAAIQSFFSGMAKGITFARLPIVPLVHFISLMADALTSLINGDMSGFSTKFQAAFASIGDIFGTIIDSVTGKVNLLSKVLTYIGNFLTNFSNSAVSSTSSVVREIGNIAGSIGQFIGTFTASAASTVVNGLNSISEAVRNLFKNMSFSFDFSGLSSGVSNGTKSLTKLAVVGSAVAKVWHGLISAFTGLAHVVGPVVSQIGSIFSTILAKVKQYIAGLDFQDALALLNTGFLIAFYHSFSQLNKNIGGSFKQLGNMFKAGAGTINQLKSSLKSLQRDVQSKIIERIAIAVGLLAAATYVLSTIDPKKLEIALGAVAALFVQLIGALAVFSKIDQKNVLKAAASILLVGGAMLLLAKAVKILSSMSLNELEKGVGTIAILLAAMSAFTRAANNTKGVVQAAFGLAILSGALLLMAGAIELYARINMGTFEKGLGLIAVSVGLIGLAFRAFPKDMIANAASLILISGALLVLAGVLKIFGSMSVGQIAKSLVELGLALAILVVGVNALNGAEAGAAALLVIAIAIRVLVPALQALGNMSLWDIIKSLLALTAVFIIIAAASVLLSEAVPFIAAFGVALLILGEAMLVAGAGFFLFSAGFALLAAVGLAGVAVMVAAFEGVLQLMPIFAEQLGLSLIAFIKVIGDSSAKIVDEFVKIVLAIIAGIGKIVPKVIDLMGNMILKMANKIVELAPKLTQAGIDVLIAFLTGVNNNIYRITSLGVSIMTNFARAIGDNAGPIVDAAFTALLKFINAVTTAIKKYTPDLQAAGGKMAAAIADGLTLGLSGKVGDVVKGAGDLGTKAYHGFMHAIGAKSPSKLFMQAAGFMGDGLIIGLNNHGAAVNAASAKMGKGAVDNILNSVAKLHNAFANEVDVSPVIAPVIDLAEVRKGAAQMSTLLAANPLTANVSLGLATAVSTDTNATLQAQQEAAAAPPQVTELKFEQTNNSPEALSTAEIYRRTNNQLSLAKAALKLPA